MLARDVRITDLDGRHLAGWLELALPPGLADGDAWALVVIDGEPPAVVGGVHSRRGALDAAAIPFAGSGRPALAALRRELGVSVVAVAERDAFAAILASAERRLSLELDYPGQALVLWRAIVECRGLWLDPPLLDVLPAVSERAVQTTFDLLVPDGTSVAAYVFDEEAARIHASVIAVKRGGDITEVATHLAVGDREDLGEAQLAARWRRDNRRILDAVGDRFAPASLGLFTERRALRRVLEGPGDQLGREMNAGNVVFAPAPAWLLGLIGGAAVAGVAARGARQVARFLPASARRAAGELARTAQDRASAAGLSPFARLGFDPIELLAQLRQFYRRRD